MKKIKQFIQENYMFLLFDLVLIVVLTHPLPYYIYNGGGILSVNDKVVVDDMTKSSGSYNLCYVSEIQATIPTYLLSYVLPDWDMVSKEEVAVNSNETNNDLSVRDQIYLRQANSNAIISAFKSSNNYYEITDINPIVLGKVEEAESDLVIGDEIISIDNIKMNRLEEITNYIETKNIGDTLNIKVMNNNKEYERTVKVKKIENNKRIGILIDEVINYKTNKKVTFSFKNSEGGPSGGFMISLALYDYLVDEDLSKGLKISGTGTIDIDGNVGSIGGVKYKLKGAVKKKSDVFFVPNGENYEEAIKLKEKNKYAIDVVGVSTLDDAINYLKNID